MRKLLFGSWLLSLFFCLSVMAQDATVSGRVTSSDDGSALPGVSVQVKGTTRGTTTDADGRYTITASPRSTLVFSFIGFVNQEVVIGNRSSIPVRLEGTANALNEVVVTGYGVSTQKRDVTSAIAIVSGKSIENLPIQTLDG